MAQQTAQIVLKIDPKLRAQAARAAKRSHMTLSAYVRQALRLALEAAAK